VKKYLWKIILIVAIAVGFTIAIIPTQGDPEKINLGLDLKGGTRLVMEVHTDEALRIEVGQSMERFRAVSAEQGLPRPETRESERGFGFVVVPPQDVPVGNYQQIARDWFQQFNSTTTQQGLVLTMASAAISDLEDQTVRQAIETIRNRVDALGVTEPIIARQGGAQADRIEIQLPGVDDPARVKEIIRTTAQLQFRIVEGQGGTQQDAMRGVTNPAQVEVFPGDARDNFGRVIGRQYYALNRAVPVTGTDLKTARVQKGQLGEPVIGFSMTPEGGRKFGDLTGQNVGRQLAILLDGKVQSAPNINSRITTDGVIEGRFSHQEAADLALILRSGSLPASLTTLEERTVGPSLGLDSIRSGVAASLAGLVLIMVIMLIYYKGAGINAVVALVLNLVILLGMMAYFGATLTLPGIAGIILTIAMAVDSNVLIFERIREELSEGKSIRASIDQGFSRAFGTIIDTNLTTMIAALFLFQFGSGPVRGFAVTLLIGLGASMFTAFFVSRVIFDLIYNTGKRPERISI
jgi:preprotein translocase subunit SecD